jgi:hypothetical protein
MEVRRDAELGAGVREAFGDGVGAVPLPAGSQMWRKRVLAWRSTPQ